MGLHERREYFRRSQLERESSEEEELWSKVNQRHDILEKEGYNSVSKTTSLLFFFQCLESVPIQNKVPVLSHHHLATLNKTCCTSKNTIQI